MSQADSSEMRAVIEAANDVFMATFNRGDAAGLAALYTEDGQLMPPNAGFMTDREAVQGFWQAVMDRGVKKAAIITGEVEGHGDTAIEVSRFQLFGEGEQELDQGKFIVIWKQVDGQWRLHRDIFNSSNPPPGS
jgi:uncharacterized protein (TIGR02246 family)